MSDFNDNQYNNGFTQNEQNAGGNTQPNGWDTGAGQNAGGGDGSYGNYNGGSYNQGNYNNGNFNNQNYNGNSNGPGQTGKKLRKSAGNKMVCGVCGGIAEYFGWDPTIVRIGWVALSLILGAGFIGLIAYFIVAVIMPEY